MANGEKSKSILEIVLMPLVIAVVGIIGTWFVTDAQNKMTAQLTAEQGGREERMAERQLNQAKEESDGNRQLKLLEIFGDKITSPNIADQRLAMGLLRLVDPALAENLTKLVEEGKSTPVEIQELARMELARRIQLSAVANPPDIASSVKTSISVMVRDANGAPLPDANVSLSAGGGKFLSSIYEPYDPNSRLNGPYSVNGKSDGAGLFTTWWVCNPCATAYVLSVEATKPEYLSGKAELTINIR